MGAQLAPTDRRGISGNWMAAGAIHFREGAPLVLRRAYAEEVRP